MNTRFVSSPKIHKRDKPILTPTSVPYPCSLLFNAGVVRFRGRYVMVFRNDYGPRDSVEFAARIREGKPEFDGTNLGLAVSQDGFEWTVDQEPCITLSDARRLIGPLIPGKDAEREIKRFYDPRLTVIEDRLYMCFAIDTAHGLRGGVAETTDLIHWEIKSASVPDNRNMVLFPEKIDGYFCRLERPVNSFGGNRLLETEAAVWFSRSPDLEYWGYSQHVLSSASVPFANSKIGPGAPPLRTDEGWLVTFHAVWRDNERGKNGWEAQWPKMYSAGIMLMDLSQPWKIKGISRSPLIAPDRWYETGRDIPEGSHFDGFRNDVIFPVGMIADENGEVRIYYGAADTVMSVATSTIPDLVSLCDSLA